MALRITRADGLVYRDQAAALCGVCPDQITMWSSRGYRNPVTGEWEYLPVAGRDGRRPLYDPVDLARAEHATAKRARRLIDPVAG